MSNILNPILVKLFSLVIISATPLKDSGDTINALLYKNGTREDIRNWRPIALSNTDSRIFSKLIANRLGKFADEFISPFQFGFVPGRNIWNNIHLINNIASATPTEGALIFLDQEKAYDRVDWDLLLHCVDYCGFPSQFSSWLKKFLNQLNIQIKLDNSFSSPIYPSRGLIQGDPFSPILYNLVFECFLLSINKQIQGIKFVDNLL